MNNKLYMLLFVLATALFQNSKVESNLQSNAEAINMNNYISIFEIPALDIPRAVRFYKNVLNINIEELEFPGMHMGLFPVEGHVTVGVIIGGEGNVPSENGVTIYLNAGDDLQFILDKIEPNGGSIKVPKTAHADESGFFAIFIDSEGNRLGLHSIN